MGHHIDAVRPWHVVALVWAASTFGVVVLMAEYLWIMPLTEAARAPGVTRDTILFAVGLTLLSYVALAVVGAPRAHRALGWTERGDDPTPAERHDTLNLPWYLFRMQAAVWTACTLALGVFSLRVDLPHALLTVGSVFAGGMATATTSFLLVTRLIKGPTTRVLEIEPPVPGTTAGVGERAVFIWALTTGVPLLSLVMVVASAPWTQPSSERVALVALVAGVIVFTVGLSAAVLFARSVGEPLNDLTRALASVEAGELDLHVPVDEWGEIGQLQAGLNRMVVALSEREQLRDLFGRHVGEDVARQALRHGVQLGGEEREAAALFVDVIGSTALAASRPPGEVVAALNRFFEVVVDVVAREGGLVNKFEGDAALCIFGAPLELPDPAASALAAAREMAVRLRMEVPELDAGIGVSQGLVIAGNIGSTQRLEYTVIGDPVNEAARLTEQAKDRPERVVASQRIVDRAGDEERRRWQLLEPLVLRGRAEPTVLAVPLA